MSPMVAHVIVVGNEKDGSGKSTTAMHVAVALLLEGRTVACLDVDTRQATLSRYLANRRAFIKAAGADHIAMPAAFALGAADGDMAAEKLRLLIDSATLNHEVVIVDTPGGADSPSRLAHSYADTLITPINDGFVALDALARVDARRMAVLGPSRYAEMVWAAKKARAGRDGGSIDWIVTRNRLASLDAHDGRTMTEVLDALARRIGIRVVPGFSERGIFRELFLAGLTILDLKDAVGPQALSASHRAARAEVQELVAALGLPEASPGAAKGEARAHS